MKKVIIIFGALLNIYSLPSLSAVCKGISSGVTINNISLTLQRDIAVGSRLAVQNFTSATASLFDCTGVSGVTSNQHLGIKAQTKFSGSTDNRGRIYETSIPGLGVQLGGLSKGVLRGWVGYDITIDGNVNQASIEVFNSSNIGMVNAAAAVSFYKIGEIASGTSTLNQQVGVMIMGYASNWAKPEIPVNISGLNVTVLACSLTTPTVAAPLGNIYATAFTGVGSTAGNNDFQLGLNCAAGTKVNVTMNGTQNADTANTSVLALTGAGGAGVAKGVGAQILYNNVPLNIGSKLALKTSAGGVETFPFKARYYQTLSNVLPGSANATATLNITYQ